MMQCISKTTRAYIYNADALKGYLLPEPIKVMEILDPIYLEEPKDIFEKRFFVNHYEDFSKRIYDSEEWKKIFKHMQYWR